jgi:hypothetical protein
MHLPTPGVLPTLAHLAWAGPLSLSKRQRYRFALILAVLAWLVPALLLAAEPDPAIETAAAEPAPQNAPVPWVQAAPAPDAAEFEALRAEFNASVRDATMARLKHYLAVFRDPKAIKRIEGRVTRLAEVDPAYLRFVADDALARLLALPEPPRHSQYFLYVDRNPAMQSIFVAFYNARTGQVELLGEDLISSGDIRKGGDYFETPTGVFEHVVDNFGYRALGTPNAEGWRGLGEKDSRVWDFGYQSGLKTYKNGTTMSQLRLLLHATDPVGGEERLGRVDSKGCIRISKGLNYFLDIHGILDMDYEQWAKTKPANWLLRKGRQPVTLPGRYLVIGDSARLAELQTASTGQPAAKQ